LKPSIARLPCALLVPVSLMGACDRHNPSSSQSEPPSVAESPSSRTNVTSTRVPASTARASSVESVAAAVCEWESRCFRLGSGGKYADRAACTNEVVVQLQYDTGTSCASGLNQAKVSACLNELRTEPCGVPKDSEKQLSTCRADALCGT